MRKLFLKALISFKRTCVYVPSSWPSKVDWHHCLVMFLSNHCGLNDKSVPPPPCMVARIAFVLGLWNWEMPCWPLMWQRPLNTEVQGNQAKFMAWQQDGTVLFAMTEQAVD